MLLLALGLKLFLFNLNGLIKRKSSIFYIPSIAIWNSEGTVINQIPFITVVLDFLTIVIIYKMN